MLKVLKLYNMGYIEFNISDELEIIERQRRETEDNFHKKEIILYETVLNFKLNFGKYNGKTIKKVLDIDKQYVYWILRETCRTGIKINAFDLSKIITYYETVKHLESCKRESEGKERQVQALVDDGMSYGVAYDIVHDRNCRDFGI